MTESQLLLREAMLYVGAGLVALAALALVWLRRSLRRPQSSVVKINCLFAMFAGLLFGAGFFVGVPVSLPSEPADGAGFVGLRELPIGAPEVNEAAPQARSGFAVEIGVFSRSQQAAPKLREAWDEGYEAYIHHTRTPSAGTLFSVRLGDYPSREEATVAAEAWRSAQAGRSGVVLPAS